MTAFLSLTFILLLSFIGGLMESASLQMTKNYRRTDMDRAIESVFAEYQKELLEEFDVFGMDGSYESAAFSEDMILDRLRYYGASGIDNQIQAMRLLTDGNGQGLRDQAARYLESKYGVEFAGKLPDDTASWEQQDEEMRKLEEYAQTQEMNLENLLTGNEVTLPVENNPLINIQALQNKPLLELVMPEGKTISEGSAELSQLLSHRERQHGYGEFSDDHEEKSIGALAFGEYLVEHFQNASDEHTNESGSLCYELEYIIEGESTDRDNLNKVIKTLLLIRMVSNYTYLSGDAAKRAEAEAMALALSTAVLLPEISGAVAQVLLLAWVFGESIMDIRSLLEGKKVPMVKTAESWQLSLDALSRLGTSEEQTTGTENSTGLSYTEYLQILLFLKEKSSGASIVTLRTLDMIEKRLRFDKGLDWLRADNCITKLEIKSTCNLRRGITYRFGTYFGYQ